MSEVVYVTTAGSRDGYYHTDKGCHRFPDSVREWDRDEAEEWGYEPCDECGEP